MEFTGERFIPGAAGDMAIEHRHRYLLAATLAAGKTVLDIASGEGYGSYILAKNAAHVTGVDIDPETVRYANATYKASQLTFLEGSATAIPLPDASVDLVVSFETIEHHDQHEAMLAEIKRVLRPGGALLMSSPDKEAFLEEGMPPNKFHVKELTRQELETLVTHYFAHHVLVPQRLMYGSSIMNEGKEGRLTGWFAQQPDELDPPAGLGSRAFYWLVLATDGELPELPQSFLRSPLDQNGMVLQIRTSLEECRSIRTHLENSVSELNTLAHEQVSHIEREAVQRQEMEAQLRGQIDEQAALLLERMRLIEGLRHECDTMSQSRSWRLTRPLRTAGKYARRIRDLMNVGEGPCWKRLLLNLPIAVVRQIRTRGVVNFVQRVQQELGSEDRLYASWQERFETLSPEETKTLYATIKGWENPPLISILMPVYNPDPQVLSEAIESVRSQSYPNWELCIADDKSPNPSVHTVLRAFAAKDSRVRVTFREENGHISRASNTALEMVQGVFTALMDHDDILPEHALYFVVKEILSHPDTDIIYSDEDKLLPEGLRSDPHFKGNWNELLFLSQNYISHLGCYRSDLLRCIGGFRVGFEGSQDHDLALRAALNSSAEHIRHIPRILYHWRQFHGSQSFSDTLLKRCEDARYRSVQDYMDAKGLNGTVERGFGGYCRVRFALPETLPLVSCVVPTRDQATLTRQCVMGLLHKTDYPNLEVLVVNNGSTDADALELFEELENTPRVRVLHWAHPFNYSAINNMAVRESRGIILALINNDIDVIEPDWLKEMVSLALLPDSGAVGAKLCYADDTIQHAGIMCGMGGVAGHLFCRTPGEHGGYMGRLQLLQWVTAVTAACLVVRREVYDAVGGLEEQLSVAFNDVDFCFKLHTAGYHNIYTPYANLYHLESVSRGTDDKPEAQERFVSEVHFIEDKWGDFLRHDEFFSPHHSRTASNCLLLDSNETPYLGSETWSKV